MLLSIVKNHIQGLQQNIKTCILVKNWLKGWIRHPWSSPKMKHSTFQLPSGHSYDITVEMDFNEMPPQFPYPSMAAISRTTRQSHQSFAATFNYNLSSSNLVKIKNKKKNHPWNWPAGQFSIMAPETMFSMKMENYHLYHYDEIMIIIDFNIFCLVLFLICDECFYFLFYLESSGSSVYQMSIKSLQMFKVWERVGRAKVKSYGLTGRLLAVPWQPFAFSSFFN